MQTTNYSRKTHGIRHCTSRKLVECGLPVWASTIALLPCRTAPTSKNALTKQEIHDAVVNLGYKFATDDPLNSIGVIVYGKNPRFVNEGRRFRKG